LIKPSDDAIDDVRAYFLPLAPRDGGLLAQSMTTQAFERRPG
jgi:hypothetical protein